MSNEIRCAYCDSKLVCCGEHYFRGVFYAKIHSCKNLNCFYHSVIKINSDHKIIDYIFYFKKNNIIYKIDGFYPSKDTLLIEFSTEIILAKYPYQHIDYNNTILINLFNKLLKLVNYV